MSVAVEESTVTAAPRARRVGRRFVPGPVRALLAVLVVGLVVYVAWAWFGELEYSEARDTWLYCGLEALAACVVGARAVHVDTDRWAMVSLAVGMFLWVGGDVFYTIEIAPLEEPPPVSFADVMYIGLYPMLILSLVLMLLERARRPPLTVWLDAIVAILAVAAISMIAVNDVLASASGDTLQATVVNGAYPALDLVTLCLLGGIWALLGWRLERMWVTLAVAYVLLAVLDMAYFVGVTGGEARPERILDFGWLAAMVLLAFAAWSPPGRGGSAPRQWNAAVMPIVVIAAVWALLVFGNIVAIPLASTILAAVALVVASARVMDVMRGLSVAAAVRRQAQEDPVTGLGNRRLLYLKLDDALSDLTADEECDLIVFNVDGFRQINDSAGHAAGDELLREIGARMRALMPPDATLVRIAADEFAVVRTGHGCRAESLDLARHVVSAMREPLEIRNTEIEISMSAGLSVCPEHAFTREGLMSGAYAAVARAKRTHIPVAVFDSEYDEVDRGQLRMTQDLRNGVRHDELVCYYQPQLDLGDGRVHCVEVLVRWRHPVEGMIYPDVFLPLAEKAGFMGTLTRAVLRQAIQQCVFWRAEGLDVRVAVNLSMTNLLDLELPAEIGAMLRAADLPPSGLILEVTETAFTAEADRVQTVRADMQALGLDVSIDDYGKGYSSLRQLRALDAKELKLDAEFVTGVAESPDQEAIVRSTAELAHELGLSVVAEGVETESDLREVARLGCDVAQGYYIRRPAPADEITKWLHKRSRTPWLVGARENAENHH